MGLRMLYNGYMGMKKIIKQVEKLADQKYDEGWSDGYDAAQAGDTSWQEGWDAKEENMKTRLNMLFDAYMAQNKMANAKMVKEIIEYLNFVVEPYDEKKYQQDLENEGF